MMCRPPLRIHALPADVARMIAEQVAEAYQKRDAARAELERLQDAVRSLAVQLADKAVWVEAYDRDMASKMRHCVEALTGLTAKLPSKSS